MVSFTELPVIFSMYMVAASCSTQYTTGASAPSLRAFTIPLASWCVQALTIQSLDTFVESSVRQVNLAYAVMTANRQRRTIKSAMKEIGTLWTHLLEA